MSSGSFSWDVHPPEMSTQSSASISLSAASFGSPWWLWQPRWLQYWLLPYLSPGPCTCMHPGAFTYWLMHSCGPWMEQGPPQETVKPFSPASNPSINNWVVGLMNGALWKVCGAPSTVSSLALCFLFQRINCVPAVMLIQQTHF